MKHTVRGNMDCGNPRKSMAVIPSLFERPCSWARGEGVCEVMEMLIVIKTPICHVRSKHIAAA